MKLKKNYITILTGTIATIIGGLFLNWYTNGNIADKIALLLIKIYNLLKDIFTYQIPLWVVMLLFIILGLLIKLVVNIIKPPFYGYREDKIYNLYWEWDWIQKDKGWDITNLRVCCPNDKTMMTHNGICPLCGFYHPAPNASLLEKVEIRIKRNAKLKEFPNKQ